MIAGFTRLSYYGNPLQLSNLAKADKVLPSDQGGFNVHLLEFTFVYQFYSRKTTLFESTF